MAIQIKGTEYLSCGRRVYISDGTIEAMVTIDTSPWITHFSLVNRGNIPFIGQDRKHHASGEEFNQLYGEGSVFYNYGNHRLWLSPKNTPNTHYPDNELVVYDILSKDASFLPVRQKRNDIQFGSEVMMNENTSNIMAVHNAKNCSRESKTFTLWPITMMAPGGLEAVPQNQGEDPLQPDRSLILWPYVGLHDAHAFLGSRFIALRQDPPITSTFKLGVISRAGWAMYARKNVALMKQYAHNIHTAYPDLDVSSGTYTSGGFLEMESLSPLYHIEPGSTVRHVKNLILQRTDQPPKLDDETVLDASVTELR